MDITNFPEDLFENNYTDTSDLQIANYEVYKHVSKNKINLKKMYSVFCWTDKRTFTFLMTSFR